MEESEGESKIDFDTFLAKIGEYGKYQRIRFYLICVSVCFYGPIALYQLIFMFSTPNGYRCRSPEENSTRFLISNESILPEICFFSNFSNNFTIDEKSCDFGYVYFFSDSPRESLVTEWDLVCNQRWIIGTVFLFKTIGSLLAALAFNYVSDSYGRKVTFFVCLTFFIPLHIVQIWLPSWKWLAATNFVTGVVGIEWFRVPWVYGFEIVGPKERTFVMFVMCVAFAIGYAAMGGIGKKEDRVCLECKNGRNR